MPVVVDHPIVRDFLDTKRAGELDPLQADKHRRAQWYADNAYTEETRRRYIDKSRAYVAHADANHFDPVHPAVEQLADYLALLANRYKAHTSVRAHANAISYYLRQHGAPDLLLAPRIKSVLAGIRREKPTGYYQALFIEDAALVIEQFDLTLPLDVRDALLVAVLANTGWRYFHAARMDRSRITFTTTGVTFFVHDSPVRELFVGSAMIPSVDVISLLRRWLQIIGTTPGPLFPGLHPRGGFGRALSEGSMSLIVRDSLSRLPKPEKARIAPLSFRKGFTQRSVERNGAIVTSQAMGNKSISALRGYAPTAGLEVDLLGQRKWGKPHVGRPSARAL
jgi:integrase